MTFCTKCGAEVPEGAEFCPKCGTQTTVSVALGRIHHLVGGTVLLIIGLAGVMGMNDWWPFVLIAIGLAVIFEGVRARSRTPRPEA